MPERKELGYANGWKDTPEIVKKCAELGHKQYHLVVGNCDHEYGCVECGYSYLVDSSG
jgi:hypothetical protein